MMEEVCQRQNMMKAFTQVKRNEGSPGVDGIPTDELLEHMKRHWSEIKEQLLQGSYQPQAVRKVEIPKQNGELRKLGIPTTTDRGKTIKSACSDIPKPCEGSRPLHGFLFVV